MYANRKRVEFNPVNSSSNKTTSLTSPISYIKGKINKQKGVVKQ